MRTNKFYLSLFLMFSLTVFMSCDKRVTEELPEDMPGDVVLPEDDISYLMPSEEAEHEGTWLQWPHRYTYGQDTPDRYDQIWIDMTKALHTGERVHIIAYNENEKDRITELLTKVNVDMNQIDFLIKKTEDVWVRDNGPIFVYDQNDELYLTNWEFNGWGGRAPYAHDNQIPSHVSNAIGVSKVDVDMVLEGGAIEVDGDGSFMATKSSILNDNRNPNMTQAEAEEILSHYLGITNFIWLEGIPGLDITDMHIDGIARFVGNHTIATMSKEDVEYYGEAVMINDYQTLISATNAKGDPYKIVELPIAIQSEGSYLNYYVGNEVVLVPNFNEGTDAQANSIIQELYPDRTVVGIMVNELWKDGGAIHCVTQQQPM